VWSRGSPNSLSIRLSGQESRIYMKCGQTMTPWKIKVKNIVLIRHSRRIKNVARGSTIADHGLNDRSDAPFYCV
jgi:hypothetical protein